MKKATILLVIVFTLMSGCGNNVVETRYATVNDLSGVTLEIKEETLSATGLTAIVRNESDDELTFGTFYCVEQKINDGWYQVPVVVEGNYGWDAIGYPIAPKSSSEFEATNWEWLYGSLKSGDYRFIKDGIIGSGSEIIRYYFAVEFSIPPLV